MHSVLLPHNPSSHIGMCLHEPVEVCARSLKYQMWPPFYIYNPGKERAAARAEGQQLFGPALRCSWGPERMLVWRKWLWLAWSVSCGIFGAVYYILDFVESDFLLSATLGPARRRRQGKNNIKYISVKGDKQPCLCSKINCLKVLNCRSLLFLNNSKKKLSKEERMAFPLCIIQRHLCLWHACLM